MGVESPSVVARREGLFFAMSCLRYMRSKKYSIPISSWVRATPAEEERARSRRRCTDRSVG